MAFLCSTKSLYPQIISYLMVRDWKLSPSNQEQDKVAHFYLCYSTLYWKYSQSIWKRKRGKKYSNWKGRSKIIFIHRWHNHIYVYRQSQRIYKKATIIKVINEFSKLQDTRSTHKIQQFLCTNSEQSKKEFIFYLQFHL